MSQSNDTLETAWIQFFLIGSELSATPTAASNPRQSWFSNRTLTKEPIVNPGHTTTKLSQSTGQAQISKRNTKFHY
jgi:hypothetical protein